jgi:hypothetical protein
MSTIITTKRKQLGGVLLLLVFVGLIFGYYVSAPDAKTPVSEPLENTTARATTTTTTGTTFKSAAEEQEPALEPAPSSTSSIKPEPTLPEAELAHLSDVFLSSLYPLFQYDFPLDREGRLAIDAFVASMPEGLSDEGLDAVSAMIQSQLRTPEAEDLAFIITHLYRLEQEEARMLSEGEPITTMEGQLEAQERLSRLREEWFGPELSARLFPGAEDIRGALYEGAGPSTKESSPDDTGSDEPPESLTEARAELADIERAWERRYQEFLADKQVIDRASLDQSEKDQQIEALFRQHYTPQELEAAKAFDQSRQ